MIRLTINGETMQVYSPNTVQQLLELLHHTGKKVAVEVNQKLIPHSLYGTTRIRQGDKIEMLRAIGGG